MLKGDVSMTAERSDALNGYVMVQLGNGQMLASVMLSPREVENWISRLRLALVGETNVVRRPVCRKCLRDCSTCNCIDNVIR